VKPDLLTHAQPRADLIAAFASTRSAFAVPPPPEPAAPDEEKKPEADQPDPDATVTSQLDKAAAAIAAAQKAQGADTGGDTAADKAVVTALDDAAAAVEAAVKAQAGDNAEDSATDKTDDAPATTAASAPPGAPADATAPDSETPVDSEGDVDAKQVCADCGHLAASHQNLDTGDNSGACAMSGCDCAGMKVGATGNTDDVNDGNDDDGDSEFALPAPEGDVAVPPAAPVEPGAPADANPPPPIEPSAQLGPAFTAVLIIEGQPSSDGRNIAVDALTWRDPPIPLMGLATETHDPEGWDLNDPAVICGVIHSIERQAGEQDTQLVIGHGNFLANDDGTYFADLVGQFGRMGISGDVAVEATQVAVVETDEIGLPISVESTLTEGVVMGATVCPFAAFEGCYIVLGDTLDGAPAAQEIPQADPAMVASTHLMAFEDCGLCGLEYGALTASSAGPLAPPASWFQDPGFNDDDGRVVEIFDGDGRANGSFACPLRVTEEGQVYGHMAPWGVCHKAFLAQGGQCITPPSSPDDYAHFKTGEIVTAEGDRVRVGALTINTGHASTEHALSARQALAHYDDTGTQVAYVTVGEDDYGIWVAGAVAPDATPEQVAKLRASTLSGDWRKLGGHLELVAALAVNDGGFPVSVVTADGRGQVALVAAGASIMAHLKDPETPGVEDPETWHSALRPLLTTVKDQAREEMRTLLASGARPNR
jgi:hypothetical protein